ncbi:DUF6233 domain-containing protein [Streptomyces sp. NPDC012508]|uniref:DUF6233 domain-containing protein n=1 Tax=Streptomyces sp. NPDC012508 TaxID=3364837 RepID=UPI00367DDB4D
MPVPVTLVLPDGQTLRARLYVRQQTRTTWMHWVGMPAWELADDDHVRAAEYRTWVTSDQVHPIEGVSYDGVETIPLPARVPDPDVRWAWKVEQVKGAAGRIAGTVVHVWDCPLAGKPREELNVDQALDALERPGARACQECGAAESLLPLLGREDG